MNNRFTSRTLGLLLSLALGLFLARPLYAADIHVFAAASLSDALKEIATDYQRATGDKLVFNLAASSTLARQIQEAAPADVFISADEEKMDALQKRGLIAEDTRRSLLSNTLVIVVDKDGTNTITTPHDLATDNFKRIALAETRTVPAGIYARSHLEKLGLWDKVSAKVIPTENVRGALVAVEAGNADAAIVYKTDALISKRVKVAHEVPAAIGPAISYPLAAVKDSKNPAGARQLIHYLASPAGLRVFEKHGFLVRR
jgi:molybdate transport system substrate-binding protein